MRRWKNLQLTFPRYILVSTWRLDIHWDSLNSTNYRQKPPNDCIFSKQGRCRQHSATHSEVRYLGSNISDGRRFALFHITSDVAASRCSHDCPLADISWWSATSHRTYRQSMPNIGVSQRTMLSLRTHQSDDTRRYDRRCSAVFVNVQHYSWQIIFSGSRWYSATFVGRRYYSRQRSKKGRQVVMCLLVNIFPVSVLVVVVLRIFWEASRGQYLRWELTPY